MFDGSQVENEVVPNDEEINEMIARSDEEFELFQRMDIERENAQGRVPRLMTEVPFILVQCPPSSFYTQGELPKWLMEEPDVGTDDLSLVYGRGFRERPKVDYDDGLTDKQWEKKISEYEDSISLNKRKRSRGSKQDEDTEDGFEEEEEEDDSRETPSKRRGTILVVYLVLLLMKPAATPTTPRTRSTNKPKTPKSSVRGKKPRIEQSAEQVDVKTRMDGVWDVVRKAADSEGRRYSELFFKLPTKKEYLKLIFLY